MHRSSRSEMFLKIMVFKNFANFTRKHLCRPLFNKVAGLTPTQVFSCGISEIITRLVFSQFLDLRGNLGYRLTLKSPIEIRLF